MTWTVCPLASNTRMPFGLGPNSCSFLPSGAVLSLETIVQVPMICSLSVFCWARALPGSMASPNALNTEILNTPRRFIVILPDFDGTLADEPRDVGVGLLCCIFYADAH